MMAVRTIVIDEAAREAASPQVVILGAGLDGRAWRMPELKDASVVMYLTPAEIEATLRVVAARSAPGSRLAIVYVGPGGWIAPIVALAVPLASSARRDARAARAARLRRAHGRDPPDVRGAHRARRRESLRRVKHVRIAIAVRR